MERYDVKCPVCGTINRNLYLKETGGWMECQCCGSNVEAVVFEDGKALPLLTAKLCEECLARTAGQVE